MPWRPGMMSWKDQPTLGLSSVSGTMGRVPSSGQLDRTWQFIGAGKSWAHGKEEFVGPSLEPVFLMLSRALGTWGKNWGSLIAVASVQQGWHLQPPSAACSQQTNMDLGYSVYLSCAYGHSYPLRRTAIEAIMLVPESSVLGGLLAPRWEPAESWNFSVTMFGLSC